MAELPYQRGCRQGFSQALHGAAIFGYEATTRWLLERGVDDIDIKDFRGRTALDLARLAGHEAVAGLLEEYGGSSGNSLKGSSSFDS